ncbi:MAG: hypothetical protein ACFCGT_08655 [Sandaracinaceae bacterium]
MRRSLPALVLLLGLAAGVGTAQPPAAPAGPSDEGEAPGEPPSAALPPAASPVEPAPARRPVGAYAGVQPGGAQPPPAVDRLARRSARGPTQIVTWPGFAMLPDGSSRFFVQMTAPVTPTAEVQGSRLVVRLPRTRVHVRNSTRWLETRFFNTPVLRARLVRRGRDTALVLHLRAPTPHQVRRATGGGFHYVYVDFPAGSYVEAPAPPPAAATTPPPAADYPELENEVPPPVDPM